MRVLIFQPALPHYRLAFFEGLASRFGRNILVYSSANEELSSPDAYARFAWHRQLRRIVQVFPGLEWQPGLLSVSLDSSDIVVVCGAPRVLSTLALIVKCKIYKVQVVWWGQLWSSSSKNWRAKIRFWLMRFPDALLLYTERERKMYLSSVAVQNSVICEALNNGLETKKIVELRRDYKASARDRDILFIGRLTKKAQLEILLRGLGTECCQNVKLDVIGNGDQRSELYNITCSYGLSDRVKWHGGLTNEEAIASIANRCKIFVYPGAVGLSIIHALNYGLPVIVHDNMLRHMPEIAALRPEINGFVFRHGSFSALAQTIHRALSAPSKLDEMSVHARSTTQKTFNTSDMVVRFVHLIEILKERRDRHAHSPGCKI